MNRNLTSCISLIGNSLESNQPENPVFDLMSLTCRFTQTWLCERSIALKRYFLVCSSSQDCPDISESLGSISRSFLSLFDCSNASIKGRSAPYRRFVKNFGFHCLADCPLSDSRCLFRLVFSFAFRLPIVVLPRRWPRLMVHRARGEGPDEKVAGHIFLIVAW